MANCLVSKLKSVVNDDNLEKFGYLRVAFDGKSTTHRLCIDQTSSRFSVKSVNNNSVDVSNKNVFDTDNYQNIPNDTIFEISTYDIVSIVLKNCIIDYGKFKYTSLNQFVLRNCTPKNDSGSISNISQIPRKLKKLQLDGCGLYGNVELLNDCIDTTSTAAVILHHNSGLYGSIDTILTTYQNIPSIYIEQTGITISRSVYDVAIARGVTVDCSSSQIVEGQ